jgi:dTDP-4-amino-4,6-dideoxygalactose transaminase
MIPAILGGKPAFKQKINIVRPALPDFPKLSGDVEHILSSGMVTKGDYLAEFETAIAEHLNVKHAIGVSSCTTGLMLTYQALGLSGEVIVPSFTFMATVSSLVWCGLHPVFIDVDPETTNINPSLITEKLTKNTSAIVAVHNFGNPAEIIDLADFATKYQLKLVFDAAHGFGALYQGIPVGNQGDAQVFSLSPTKLLIAGEGGIVATNNDDLARKIRMGREYGNSGNYDSAFAGMNARMPEFNAILGYQSLKMLEQAATSRNETAGLFTELLGKIPGLDFQKVNPGNRSSYKDFSITIDTDRFGLPRDQLMRALTAENIDTRKYYDPPVHLQTAYQKYYDGLPLPQTDWLVASSLSLPIWTNMDNMVAMKICEAIEKIHENATAIQSISN